MNEQDFYGLKIGEVIYYNGVMDRILTLETFGGGKRLRLGTRCGYDLWTDICKNCSLTPPKQKTKYYQWLLKYEDNSSIVIPDCILSEEGLLTNGKRYANAEEWKRIKVSKVGNFVWEE